MKQGERLWMSSRSWEIQGRRSYSWIFRSNTDWYTKETEITKIIQKYINLSDYNQSLSKLGIPTDA